jgi:REP element-mobilizing transposase RayT
LIIRHYIPYSSPGLTAFTLGRLKSHSSKWIKKKGLYYKNFSWQGGYGAFSVSESVSPIVKRYINRQEEHHKQITTKDEYIQLLTKNAVPFDEQYLFDE